MCFASKPSLSQRITREIWTGRLRRQPEIVGSGRTEKGHGSQSGGICEAGGGDLQEGVRIINLR